MWDTGTRGIKGFGTRVVCLESGRKDNLNQGRTGEAGVDSMVGGSVEKKG